MYLLSFSEYVLHVSSFEEKYFFMEQRHFLRVKLRSGKRKIEINGCLRTKISLHDIHPTSALTNFHFSMPRL